MLLDLFFAVDGASPCSASLIPHLQHCLEACVLCRFRPESLPFLPSLPAFSSRSEKGSNAFGAFSSWSTSGIDSCLAESGPTPDRVPCTHLFLTAGSVSASNQRLNSIPASMCPQCVGQSFIKSIVSNQNSSKSSIAAQRHIAMQPLGDVLSFLVDISQRWHVLKQYFDRLTSDLRQLQRSHDRRSVAMPSSFLLLPLLLLLALSSVDAHLVRTRKLLQLTVNVSVAGSPSFSFCHRSPPAALMRLCRESVSRTFPYGIHQLIERHHSVAGSVKTKSPHDDATAPSM